MIDWKRGGKTGSINRWARREVRDWYRHNPAARHARYGWVHGLMRAFFSIAGFGRFLCLYAIVDCIAIAAQTFAAFLPCKWLSSLPASSDGDATLLNVASYLITAQVGALGLVSLGLALVTLIAQREDASTDVSVYYHQSLAFEVVASCIALLAVLCVQLLWPAQLLLGVAGIGAAPQIFKWILLYVHLAWLLMNLGGLAHFIATTFGFVHRSERQRLRERYTANVSQPAILTLRLRQQIYSGASVEILKTDGHSDRNPTAFFGTDMGAPFEVEMMSNFKSGMALYDVRMSCVTWVLRRWSARCLKEMVRKTGAAAPNTPGPVIWFTPVLDRPILGRIEWCRRQGGAHLFWFERTVLWYAFRFRRVPDEA